ncbi:unnamed protein product [Enterobius vermicularis]|uniref:CRIB domain-containing protein n=1 Tax=Enterobius vermicularis TaxID=51028 RepID=A0A0N4VMJ6_ENTVE|nr:unnamed protein product [Enterobius vermicularis]
MGQKNEESMTLSYEQNQSVFSQLGAGCYSLATGFAELLQKNATDDSWNKIDTGAICYVQNSNRKEYSLRLIDPGFNSNPPSEKCKILISADIEFSKDYPNLVTFTSSDNLFYGLNFSHNKEAGKFFGRVQYFQNERQKTAVQQEVQPMMIEQKSAEERSPLSFERSYVSAGFTNMHSLQAEGVHGGFIVKTNFVNISPAGFKRDKRVKEKKEEKIPKAAISYPKNFKHIAHIGDGAFCLNSPTIDPTVRDMFFFPNGFSQAVKKEPSGMRRQISKKEPEVCNATGLSSLQKISSFNERSPRRPPRPPPLQRPKTELVKDYENGIIKHEVCDKKNSPNFSNAHRCPSGRPPLCHKPSNIPNVEHKQLASRSPETANFAGQSTPTSSAFKKKLELAVCANYNHRRPDNSRPREITAENIDPSFRDKMRISS